MSPQQQNNEPVTASSSQSNEKRSLEQLGQWISTHLEREPDDIKAVLQKERAWIEQRRENIQIKAAGDKIEISAQTPAKSAVGLALSGGGIRSATFNLGLLQALERYRLLWHVDYLSTVSGGGYIGAALTWFKSITAPKKGEPQKPTNPDDEDDTFPFGTQRVHHAGIGGKVLAWLRSYGYYLTPGDGLTVWSLIAAIITGMLVNLVIMVPPFMLAFYLLSRTPATLFQPLEWLNQLIAPGVAGRGFIVLLITGALGVLIYGIRACIYLVARKTAVYQKDKKKRRRIQSTAAKLLLSGTLVLAGISPLFFPELPFLLHRLFAIGIIGIGFSTLLLASLTALAVFFGMLGVYVVSTIIPKLRAFIVQRRMREWAGMMLMYAVLFAVVSTIPLVYFAVLKWIPSLVAEAMSAFSISGVISILSTLKGRKGGNETRGWRSLLLSIGLALLSYGIFLWFYDIIILSPPITLSIWFWIGVAVWGVLTFLANCNQISMHRYYRNRLMEAYMPYSIHGAGVWREQPPHWYPYATHKTADRFRLGGIPKTDAPYHIINTNLQTIGSDEPKLSRRGGDSFIFSPQYCGAQSTGYALTDNYMGGDMDLATAFAISGAAVDPNTYATRSRPLSFLMTLLNIRLGYWCPNPRYPQFSRRKIRPWWWLYMLYEMLGRGLTEKRMQVHLSDGGHFENLGLYELVQRRCRYIIVSDAAADPNFSFADLAKAIEMVRVDFGAEIDIDICDIRPQGDDKRCKHAFALGKIAYNPTGPGDEAEEADLLYIKTALIDNLTQDIYGYQRSHNAFPDETTADQFFSEPQFEAYRELGFLLGSLVCGEMNAKKMDSFFERTDHYLKKTKKKNTLYRKV